MKPKKQEKKILILVGGSKTGKTVLSDFIKNIVDTCYCDECAVIIDMCLEELTSKKQKQMIKQFNMKKGNKGFFFVVHLQSEDEIKQISIALRRRAWIFGITPLEV